jgi:hypothetical protein
MQQEEKFAGWAVIELFGRQRAAGYCTEATLDGAGFLRVDVPDAERAARHGYTRYFGPAAIYSVVQVSEEIARRYAENMTNEPISAYQLALPAPIGSDEDEDEPF